MIRQKYQRVTDPAAYLGGDCFAACVAMVLDLDQDRVPNFCTLGPDWWQIFQNWISALGLTAVEVRLPTPPWTNLRQITSGTPLILSGKSPRGDWDHSVVGLTHPDGFELLFDPHPNGGFMDGHPKDALFFASLRPDLVRTRHDSTPPAGVARPDTGAV